MNCPQCGTENPAGNKFCMKCGADMTAPFEAGATAGQPQSTYAPPSAPPSYGSSYTPPLGAPQPGYTPFGSTGSAAVQGRLIGFGPRFLAWLIDYVVLVVIGVVLNIIHLGGLGTLVNLAYFIYFWSTTGQTLGMMAMRIRVARADGQPLTWSTGILRVIGYIISAIPLGLGLWWVIWDPQKQGWHDKIASTVVVPAQ